MTTKPDFNLIRDLQEVYTPKTRGIVSQTEIQLIKEKLELEQRTVIELRNVRNTVVMIYGRRADSFQDKDPSKMMELMDAMSAITAVIDEVLFNRGEEV